MTNWNLEENVTSLEDSKLLKEHGIEMEPDGYWAKCVKSGGMNLALGQIIFYSLQDLEEQDYNDRDCGRTIFTNAYRLDKLLAEVKQRKLPPSKEEREKVIALLEQLKRYLNLFSAKGLIKLAIKACVQLLVLLATERSEDKKEGVE